MLGGDLSTQAPEVGSCLEQMLDCRQALADVAVKGP